MIRCDVVDGDVRCKNEAMFYVEMHGIPGHMCRKHFLKVVQSGPAIIKVARPKP